LETPRPDQPSEKKDLTWLGERLDSAVARYP
jgi:hypothetical protein